MDDKDYGKEGDPEERHVHRIVRNYVNSFNQSNVEGGLNEDSTDNDIQLERRIHAWNSGDTKRMDITTSKDKGAPMELPEIVDKPWTERSMDDKNKE